MGKLTVIGDVHGKFDAYKQIANGSEYSIQLGDMGFNYSELNTLDSFRHKFFHGNHDNPNEYNKYPHYLGRFGNANLNGVDFFFVSGAFSVDIMYRLHGNMNGQKGWWHEEQLTYNEMIECEKLYLETKPDLVITHTAPTKVIRDNFSTFTINRLGFSDNFQDHTSGLLQRMFEQHQPKLWVFGHFHRRISDNINGTEFVCLEELGFVDL